VFGLSFTARSRLITIENATPGLLAVGQSFVRSTNLLTLTSPHPACTAVANRHFANVSQSRDDRPLPVRNAKMPSTSPVHMQKLHVRGDEE
jgi:hypothetical protein